MIAQLKKKSNQRDFTATLRNAKVNRIPQIEDEIETGQQEVLTPSTPDQKMNNLKEGLLRAMTGSDHK